MKTLLSISGFAFLLAACGGHEAAARHPAMPIQGVNERGDEWLHDHCDVKKVAKLDSEAVEAAATAAGSNFVEVLYSDSGGDGVVMFSCKDLKEFASQ